MAYPADPVKIKKPFPREEFKTQKVKTHNLTVSLYRGDKELVELIVDFLGSNRSDAVRTAIRAYAFHIKSITK